MDTQSTFTAMGPSSALERHPAPRHATSTPAWWRAQPRRRVPGDQGQWIRKAWIWRDITRHQAHSKLAAETLTEAPVCFSTAPQTFGQVAGKVIPVLDSFTGLLGVNGKCVHQEPAHGSPCNHKETLPFGFPPADHLSRKQTRNQPAGGSSPSSGAARAEHGARSQCSSRRTRRRCCAHPAAATTERVRLRATPSAAVLLGTLRASTCGHDGGSGN